MNVSEAMTTAPVIFEWSDISQLLTLISCSPCIEYRGHHWSGHWYCCTATPDSFGHSPDHQNDEK